jgi:putative hydrolase of the HAD superfamily
MDFGGVLVRTATRNSRQSWEERLGLLDGALDDIVFNSDMANLATIGKATMNDVWAYVQANLNLNDLELELLIKDFWSEDFLDSELIHELINLRERYVTAILSNIWTDARTFFKQNYAIQEGITVDKLFLSCEMGLAKPDPQIYKQTADDLEVQFDEILFIDDNKDNIISANALGINIHHFYDPKDALSLLRGLM